ncbi:MAG: hypothetical protein ACRD29_08685 [Acidimicrobiales bacterium]
MAAAFSAAGLVLTVLATLLVGASPADAAPTNCPPSAGADGGGDGAARVQVGGRCPTPGRPGGSPISCRLRLHPGYTDASWTHHEQLPDVTDPEVGSTYLIICIEGGDPRQEVRNEFIVWDPGVVAADLARLAASQLDVVFPGAHTSPDRRVNQLVTLPTWLWVPADAWVPQSATASIAGLISATATATPDHVRWSMGDGVSLTCPGPGTPYAAGASTDCSHTYTRAAQGIGVTAVMVWDLTWDASSGDRGTLPDFQRSETFSLTVVGGEAIVVD